MTGLSRLRPSWLLFRVKPLGLERGLSRVGRFFSRRTPPAVITIDASLLQIEDDVSDREMDGAALWRTKPLTARLVLDALRVEADRLRDKGHSAAAAACYARAVELSPWRNDLRVQQANMLKDLGNLGDAELIYRRALKIAPDDADIHLQLGHVLKLMG